MVRCGLSPSNIPVYSHLSSTRGPKKMDSGNCISNHHLSIIVRRKDSMNYVAADVKKLREETGATFADCKNALTEAGAWNDAVRILEARSDRKAEKMIAAGRETKEGGIFSYVHHNNRVGVLLELNCSTDFVARSESFRNLANELALQIVGIAPKYVSYEDVPADVIVEEQKKIAEDPSLERVPTERREEVISSKLKK